MNKLHSLKLIFRVFADVLKSKLKEACVKVIENHDFRPHMTVMKVSFSIGQGSPACQLNSLDYMLLMYVGYTVSATQLRLHSYFCLHTCVEQKRENKLLGPMLHHIIVIC